MAELGKAIAALDLDWDLAIRRFKRDLRDDFFPDPRDYLDITANRERTIARIGARLDDYAPQRASWGAGESAGEGVEASALGRDTRGSGEMNERIQAWHSRSSASS